MGRGTGQGVSAATPTPQQLLFGRRRQPAPHDWQRERRRLDRLFEQGDWEAARHTLLALHSQPDFIAEVLDDRHEMLLAALGQSHRWLREIYTNELTVGSALATSIQQPWPDHFRLGPGSAQFALKVTGHGLEQYLLAHLRDPNPGQLALIKQQGYQCFARNRQHPSPRIAIRLLKTVQPGTAANQALLDGLAAGADTIRRSANGKGRAFSRRTQGLFTDLGLSNTRSTTIFLDHEDNTLHLGRNHKTACGQATASLKLMKRGRWSWSSKQQCPVCQASNATFPEAHESEFNWSPLTETEQQRLVTITRTTVDQAVADPDYRQQFDHNGLLALRQQLWAARAHNTNESAAEQIAKQPARQLWDRLELTSAAEKAEQLDCLPATDEIARWFDDYSPWARNTESRLGRVRNRAQIWLDQTAAELSPAAYEI